MYSWESLLKKAGIDSVCFGKLSARVFRDGLVSLGVSSASSENLDSDHQNP